MYRNKTYTGTLSFLIACAVLLFGGLGMGEEGKAPGVPDIKEARKEAEAASKAIRPFVRDQDYGKVSELSSQIIDKYGSIEDTVVQKYVIEAMSRVASRMEIEKDSDKAVEMYEQIEKKYGKMDDGTFQFWVAEAIYFRGLIYKIDLHDYKKALKHFKRVQKEYKNSTDIEIQRVVTHAMYQEGLTYKKLGKTNMAEKCFRAIVREFGKKENEKIKRTVLSAQEELDEKKA